MKLPRLVMIGVACAALAAAVALQLARDQAYPRADAARARMLYVRSPAAIDRLALGFDALAADIYWIRAIQHFGGERLATERIRDFSLLYPLLDIATTLDPYFNIAYRFGGIFLSEAYPGGPGRPDLAVRLLQKGIAAQPAKWQYYHDLAFVYYWHYQDYRTAAEWFQRASEQPNAPNWLAPMAATLLVRGEDRASARMLWRQILESEEEWLRRTAERSLLQIDALDAIDAIEAAVRRRPLAEGERYSWSQLVRQGVLRGVPADPSGTPFEIDSVTGDVTVSPSSPLHPLPVNQGQTPQ